MVEVTNNRMNPFIDPDLHIWHGEVAADLFLAAMVGGIMALTAVLYFWAPRKECSRGYCLLPWISPLLISFCLLFLWIDLGNKFNAFRFFFVLKSYSFMSWGSWIILMTYPASMLFAWGGSPPDFKERWLKRMPFIAGVGAWADRHRRGIAIWNFVTGIALGLYTGALLAFYAARPLWNSPILPLLFLSSGVACAAAYMLLVRLTDFERTVIGRVLVGALISQALFNALWFFGLETASDSGRMALDLFTGKQYTAAYWSLVVGMGLVIPLMTAWFRKLRNQGLQRAVTFFVLAGAFALRWLIIFAGQHSDSAGHVAGLGG